MLTLVLGMPVSKGKVNRSLDLCLIAKETTGDCEQGFILNGFNEVLYKLDLQVMVLNHTFKNKMNNKTSKCFSIVIQF